MPKTNPSKIPNAKGDEETEGPEIDDDEDDEERDDEDDEEGM